MTCDWKGEVSEGLSSVGVVPVRWVELRWLLVAVAASFKKGSTCTGRNLQHPCRLDHMSRRRVLEGATANLDCRGQDHGMQGTSSFLVRKRPLLRSYR